MNKIFILIIVLFLCCLILIIGITVYFLNKKKINSSQKNPNENDEKNKINNLLQINPKENDKKTQVYNLGQILQKDELVLSDNNYNILFTIIPSGIISTNPVIYSMSFDCYIETPGDRVIFTINDMFGDISIGLLDNHFVFYFISGGNIMNGAVLKPSKFITPIKQWFNVTFVVQNNNFSAYFDGIKEDGTKVGEGITKWFTNKIFRWNLNVVGVSNRTFGSIKVNNFVFWDIPLTKSQIDIISKQ